MDKYITKLKEIKSEKATDCIKLLESINSETPKPERREAIESALDLIEADRTSNDTRELLRAALKENSSTEWGPWIIDFSDTFVIYEEDEGPIWKADYSIMDNKVTFGTPVKVVQKTIYEPLIEASKNEKKETITGDFVKLIESAIGEDGTIPIKIIQPGWGSSGYYSEEVLERDASVYTEGTKMYWNHPTASDEFERPERSLNDLAGVLVSEGVYNNSGAEGAGIYAKAKVFADYQNSVDELASNIGLSHIAGGTAKMGEAEGKSGRIIESLNVAESVDFVTYAGAGGAIIKLFESASKKQLTKPIIKMEESKELTKLKESNQAKDDEIKKLKEKEVLSDAKEFVTDKLKESELPDEAKVRLSDRLIANVMVDDKGGLDLIKFGESVKKEIEAETSYLASLTKSGKIIGMGSSHEDDKTSEKFQESNKKAFESLGYTGTQLENAVKGRD